MQATAAQLSNTRSADNQAPAGSRRRRSSSSWGRSRAKQCDQPLTATGAGLQLRSTGSQRSKYSQPVQTSQPLTASDERGVAGVGVAHAAERRRLDLLHAPPPRLGLATQRRQRRLGLGSLALCWCVCFLHVCPPT